MNGPEHYRKAEECLARAADTNQESLELYWTQAAQAHAMLALVAATAVHSPNGVRTDWAEVLGR